MIETAHFHMIPCRSCLATTMVLRGRRPPSKCVKCQSPYDEASATYDGKPAQFQPIRPAGFTRTDPPTH